MGSAQNCLWPSGLQRSVCTLGAKESHRWWQSSLYGTVWAFLVSIWHVTLIKEGCFGAETWLITQNLKPEKGCVVEKLSTPFSKENGSIVISQDDSGKLSWDHRHVLVLDFLDRVDTVWAECCCGTLSLQWPFFAKGLSYFTKVLSFCMKMPGIIHPTGQLFMAVHLICYGSVPILCSVFYLSLNPWEAPGWQMVAVDADVKQGIASWLQTLDSNVFTLDYEPWYQCRVNVEMAVVSLLRSDVYHLFHMCHILIKVTMSVFYLIFWKFFVYTMQSEQVGS